MLSLSLNEYRRVFWLHAQKRLSRLVDVLFVSIETLIDFSSAPNWQVLRTTRMSSAEIEIVVENTCPGSLNAADDDVCLLEDSAKEDTKK